MDQSQAPVLEALAAYRCPSRRRPAESPPRCSPPYPPGIPAALPGERLNDDVTDYLRSGVDAGMLVPDSADPELASLRVVVET